MVQYLRRAPDAKAITNGRKAVVVKDPSKILAAARNLDFDNEYLLLEKLPVIQENRYVKGDQTPYNRHDKHADSVVLHNYRSHTAANNDARPLYVQRREAYENLQRKWRAACKEVGYHLVDRSSLAWRQPGGTGITYLTLVDSYKSLERLFTTNKRKGAPERIHLNCKYGPKDDVDLKGVTMWFGLPSIGEDKQYSIDENSIAHVPFIDNPMMYTLAMWLDPKHGCGTSNNKGTRFKTVLGLKDINIICEHSGSAILENVLRQQMVMRKPSRASKFRNFSRADVVYDRFARKHATVPMYLCAIPLPNRKELKVFRALYHHTVITRPRRDKVRGGFQRTEDRKVIFDKPQRLWEQEIEKILWTDVAEKGKKALFADEHVMNYEPYLFGLVPAK
jgi:hypothetical protein